MSVFGTAQRLFEYCTLHCRVSELEGDRAHPVASRPIRHAGQATQWREPGPMERRRSADSLHRSRLSLRSAGMTDRGSLVQTGLALPTIEGEIGMTMAIAAPVRIGQTRPYLTSGICLK